MTAPDTQLLVGLILMGSILLGLAWYTRFILVSVASCLVYFSALAAIISGGVGPGFTEEWVQALSLALICLCVAPLTLQMRVEVQNEKRFGQDNYNWKSFEKRGWTPDRQSAYEKHRGDIRKLAERGVSRSRSRRPSRQGDDFVR